MSFSSASSAQPSALPLSQFPYFVAEQKATIDIDFRTLLGHYIEQVYGDDPQKHSEAIQTFSRLRNDIQGLRHSLVGAAAQPGQKPQQTSTLARDLLYKYFGQLELFGLHFPPDEDKLQLPFCWHDAFAKSAPPVTQTSIAYEKACIIFNLAAVLSGMAASQNRSVDDGSGGAGLKLAFNYLQCSAGVFKYISDNFLHAPSKDMSQATINMLVQLMLAQAQECFVEKAIGERKKSSMLVKLVAHLAQAYAGVLECLNHPELGSGYLPAYLLPLVKLKQKYFLAVAHHHKSLMCEADAKYGLQVAHATVAENLAKEASKFAKELAAISKTDLLVGGNAGGAKTDGKATTLCTEIVKQALAFFTEKKNAAVRDNDVIYNDRVPNPETLEPLEFLNMTASKKLTEVFPEMKTLIGEDIFKNLIPLSVHMQESVYSEEKAKLLRTEKEKVAESDAEMMARMESMGLPAALDKIKQLSRGGASAAVNTENTEVPKEVLEWAENVRTAERHDPLSHLLQSLDGLREDCRVVIDEAAGVLDQEQTDYDAMKEKHGNKWTMAPSTSQNGTFRQDIKRHRDNLQKGMAGDQMLQTRYVSCEADIKILNGSPDGIQAAYVEAISKVVSESGCGSQGSISLLDVNDSSADAERNLVAKVDGLIQQLLALKKTRKACLEEMQALANKDDIKDLLVLNQSNEENVFKLELEKFKVPRDKIADTYAQQARLMEQLSVDHGKLAKSSLAKQSIGIAQARTAIARRFNDTRTTYAEIRTNAMAGIQFYSELKDLVDQLLHGCKKFSATRRGEREKVASQLAAAYTDVLKQKLDQVSLKPAATSAPLSTAPLATPALMQLSTPAAASSSTSQLPPTSSAPPMMPPPTGAPSQHPSMAPAGYGYPPYGGGQPHGSVYPLHPMGAMPPPNMMMQGMPPPMGYNPYGATPPPTGGSYYPPPYGMPPPMAGQPPPPGQQPMYGGYPPPQHQHQPPPYPYAPYPPPPGGSAPSGSGQHPPQPPLI